MPRSAFPPGSRIVFSRIESNRLLLHDGTPYFGLSPALLGRRTGYALLATGAGEAPHASLGYLVSVFGTVKQAEIAYSTRWETWFTTNFNTSPPPPPVVVGDRGAEAFFRTLDPRLPPVTELLFRRGSLLIEVVARAVRTEGKDRDTGAIAGIAARLDRVARGLLVPRARIE